ncbi:uncharacterized protein LOC126409693 [Nymphaea colorata]|nr:uncharacterized protein LOC126409693 [Nymphaea colorata]
MQPPSNDHISLSASYDNRNFRNRSGKKPTYFCNHCNITGHSRERCFKLNGYPPNFREGRIKGDKVPKPNSGDQSKTAFIAATSNTQSNDSGKELALAFTVEEFLQLKQILKDRSTPLTSFAGPDLQDNDWSG